MYVYNNSTKNKDIDVPATLILQQTHKSYGSNWPKLDMLTTVFEWTVNV